MTSSHWIAIAFAGACLAALPWILHAGPVKRFRRALRTRRAERAWFRPATPVARPVPSRLVVSFTTSPDRIVPLERVVRTMLNQSCPPDEVHLNVPHVFGRTGRGYDIPDWCGTLDPRIKLFRVDDMGPATKSVPTILRFAPDEDVVIVFADDDVLYMQRTLEVFCDEIRADPGCAYGFSGYDIGPDYRNLGGRNRASVQCLEGWAGVAAHRRAYGDGLAAYVDAAHRSRACFLQDDVVLGNYFELNGVRRIRLDDPRASVRGMRALGAQLAYGYLDDALHRGTEGPAGEPLLRAWDIEAHLVSIGLWALPRHEPRARPQAEAAR